MYIIRIYLNPMKWRYVFPYSKYGRYSLNILGKSPFKPINQHRFSNFYVRVLFDAMIWSEDQILFLWYNGNQLNKKLSLGHVHQGCHTIEKKFGYFKLITKLFRLFPDNILFYIYIVYEWKKTDPYNMIHNVHTYMHTQYAHIHKHKHKYIHMQTRIHINAYICMQTPTITANKTNIPGGWRPIALKKYESRKIKSSQYIRN